MHTVRVMGRIVSAWVGLFLATRPITAQQSVPTSAVVFNDVTVIDVEHGTRLPDQRVVVTGNRITAMGASTTVKVPQGAQIVEAKGKYLIPGLWDAHTHPGGFAETLFYPLYIANGVTGIRDAGSPVPLKTLRLFRQEILAGTRVGPPRQFLSGQSIAGPPPVAEGPGEPCDRRDFATIVQTCVADEADAIHYVDSLKEAGADMVKLRSVNSTSLYYTIVREARRMGLLYGGHIQRGMPITPMEAADSGVTFLDHINAAGYMDTLCLAPQGETKGGVVASCRIVTEHLARHNSWFVPTANLYVSFGKIPGARAEAVSTCLKEFAHAYWTDSIPVNQLPQNWLHCPALDTLRLPPPDSIGFMRIAQQVGLPIVTGTDAGVDWAGEMPPGFGIHAELATLVVEGMTPVAALQAATLNPAKAFRMTDSLGTVAPGKLADLVLLDADPLADIANIVRIRAVVANGRYFDRTALDQLLISARKY